MDAVDYLSWDSNFFKKKIGKYELSVGGNSENVEKTLIQAQQQAYKLIYLFVPEGQSISKGVLDRFNAELVDTKLVYARKLDEGFEYDNPYIQLYNKNPTNKPNYRIKH